MRTRDERLVGPVAITCSDAYVSRLLMPALSALCHAHPGIELSLTVDSRNYDLARREADLAVRALGPNAAPPQFLIGQKLVPIVLANCVAVAHAAQLDPEVDGARPRWLSFADRKLQDSLIASSSYPVVPARPRRASARCAPRSRRCYESTQRCSRAAQVDTPAPARPKNALRAGQGGPLCWTAAMTDQALFWNQIAEKYARQPVADPDAFERKIAIHVGRLRPHHVVLDIGCGTGSLALRLAPFAGHVHGLDISQEMIRIARDKARGQAMANVTFDVGPFDAGLTRFAPGSFDVVSAYSLLHLLEDRPQALARVLTLLKPGGVFVSSNVCLGDSWVPYRPLLAIMHALGKAPPVRIFSRQTLERELREAGFVDLQQPDVGADKTIAFVVALKPRLGSDD